ncbi:glycoside hydrolase family 13 protein [Lapillicoccus sp.]|uniref:glycoside hydrolase family 13 protein n=1 Tax=Lapillicoccus sp. TaxID=1909287 RepID=UPI003265A03D
MATRAETDDLTAHWWRDAVTYQIYPRSWSDSDGDGMGDLPGITARLGYLRKLGVDAIWLSPFYPSPQADAGYDVADYRDVDPRFGTLADADALVARAAELGIKVLGDLVPNHSSDEHVWFQAALASAPGSPERARYHFRDGRGSRGDEPPNNWRSVFGGIAWTRVTQADGRPDQWYLHLFDAKQPDFNWENLEVRADFVRTLRFWLDRGFFGFRVDVAHGLVKDPALPDWDVDLRLLDSWRDADPTGDKPRPPMFDQDGVHEIYREWRAVLDSYGTPDRVLCAEAWVEPVERAVRYIRPDEMHQTFNFDFLECPWGAAKLTEVIDHSLRVSDSVGAPTTWVLSNHDVVRHASRLGLPSGTKRPHGIGADDPQPDLELGLRRARAATTLMLALPGAAYLYQGEELGLPDSTTMADEFRQDPAFFRTHGIELGRDGCRVPLPWAHDEPSLGFGPSAHTWLPQPETYAEYAVDVQEGRPGSTLELYRSLLALRREYRLGRGRLQWLQAYSSVSGVVAFASQADERSDVVVLVNLGDSPVDLPASARVLVASGELTDGRLPTDTAVWLAV